MNAYMRTDWIVSILFILAAFCGSAGCGRDDGGAAHSHPSGEATGAAEKEGTHDAEEVEAGSRDEAVHGAEGEAGGRHNGNIEIEMSAGEIAEAGIDLAPAGGGRISRAVDLPGEIKANGDRLVSIVPRAQGIVTEVRASLGDMVARGQVLAVMESGDLADLKASYVASVEREGLARTVFEREERLLGRKISSEQEYLDARRALAEAGIERRSSEQKLLSMGFSPSDLGSLPDRDGADYTRYEISAPIAGTLIGKTVAQGEVVEEGSEIFVIADLGSVWVDINVFEKDLGCLRKGQKVTVFGEGSAPVAQGKIDYVGPVLGTSTRTALARAVLANRDGILRPGTFVRAAIELESIEAQVAVLSEAVQQLEDVKVVFVRTDRGFEAVPVETGISDGGLTEIAKGISAGQIYAGRGSFSIKAKYVTGGLDSHAGHGH